MTNITAPLPTYTPPPAPNLPAAPPSTPVAVTQPDAPSSNPQQQTAQDNAPPQAAHVTTAAIYTALATESSSTIRGTGLNTTV